MIIFDSGGPVPPAMTGGNGPMAERSRRKYTIAVFKINSIRPITLLSLIIFLPLISGDMRFISIFEYCYSYT